MGLSKDREFTIIAFYRSVNSLRRGFSSYRVLPCSGGEMADALALGASTFGCESSSLSPSTTLNVVESILSLTLSMKTVSKKPEKNTVQVNFHLEKEHDFKKFMLYLSRPWHIMWRNFLAGTFQAMGFLFGSAILIAVLSFILNTILGEVPFFSDFTKALNLWLETTMNARS